MSSAQFKADDLSEIRKFGSNANLSLQSGGVNSTIKSCQYQMKVFLLGIVKSFEASADKSFSISTEVKQAAPFDDVLVEHQGKTILIQAKSKEEPIELGFKSFFENKTNFSLWKYFKGYVELIKHFENVDKVVICTNNRIEKSNRNCVILHGPENIGDIQLKKVKSSDFIFENFPKKFKIGQDSSETKDLLREKFIKEMLKEKPTLGKEGVTELIDDNLDNFLKQFLLIFDMKETDIDSEVNEYLKERFNLNNVDHLNSTIMNMLNEWITNLKSFSYIDSQKFDSFLENVKRVHFNIQNIIDRTSGIFQSTPIKFKKEEEIKRLIQRIDKKNGKSQNFYLKTEKGDSFFGGCLVYQAIKNVLHADEFLFLKSDFSTQYFEDGLAGFSEKKTFNLLIFIENEKKVISESHRDQIDNILEKNPDKKFLLVTDRSVETDNSIPKVMLSDITEQSLELLLRRSVEFQGELLQLKDVIDPSKKNLIKSIQLENVFEVATIGNKIKLIKEFDQELYVPRRLMLKNHINYNILDNTKKVKKKIRKIDVTAYIKGDWNNDEGLIDVIFFDEKFFDVSCKKSKIEDNGDNGSIHLLSREKNMKNFIWKQTKGPLNNVLNHTVIEGGTILPPDYHVDETKPFILCDIAGMGKY